MPGLLLAGLLTLGITLVFAALGILVSQPSRVNAIVEQYRQPLTLEEAELSQPFSTRILKPFLFQVARLITQYTPHSLIESIQLKLELAGNPFGLPALEFMGLRGLSTIFIAIFLGLVGQFLNMQVWLIGLFIIIGSILGFYLPMLWLDAMIRSRREEIDYALPDALDMLTICVEAGLGLDAAMTRVSEKWDNALARAFRRAIREIQVGTTREKALRDMAITCSSAELTNFVAAIIQIEKLGGGLAKLLRIQSEQMRVMRRQRAYAVVNQMPVKMVFPLIFCFFPSLFIVLLGPAIIKIITSGFN